MPLSPGVRLGPYEIVAPLGAGGMGEVYRARDTRLERTVALKILRDDLHHDAASRARFEREARSAAALSHPNICAIHDVGSAAIDGRGDVQYLVLELLDGEPLSTRIQRGALPLEDALSIVRQILTALVAAHRAGLVHRDLKPANVMLTKTGVKLLDFGLAKPSAVPVRGRPQDAEASTRAADPLTGPATLVGTPHYMSPEQLEGREVDARTDLWAAGVVLYEMLTGQRPFEGASTASLVGAILKDEPPPLGARVSLAPPALDHVVRRALVKDPDERWQSARDLLDAVEQAAAPPASPAPPRAPARRWPGLVAASLVGASAVATLATVRGVPPSPEGTPLTIDLARPTTFRLPSMGMGDEGLWLPSPDDRWLLGIERVGDGRTRFLLRDVRTGAVRALPSTVGHVRSANAAWAPDSSDVAYFDGSDSLVKRVKVETSRVTALGPVREVRGLAWSSDGIVATGFATASSTWIRWSSNNEPAAAIPGRGFQPSPVGDGRFIARKGADTVLLSAGEAVPHVLLPGGAVASTQTANFCTSSRGGSSRSASTCRRRAS